MAPDPSDCPKCGEWRDGPDRDCAGCGYEPDRTDLDACPPVLTVERLAEALHHVNFPAAVGMDHALHAGVCEWSARAILVRLGGPVSGAARPALLAAVAPEPPAPRTETLPITDGAEWPAADSSRYTSIRPLARDVEPGPRERR